VLGGVKVNRDPSEPSPRPLKVKVPLTISLFCCLRPPRAVNEPVKLGRLGSSSGTATSLPVAVKVEWMRPSSKVVVCSTWLVVVVMVQSGPGSSGRWFR
jgi:hypothetical protein